MSSFNLVFTVIILRDILLRQFGNRFKFLSGPLFPFLLKGGAMEKVNRHDLRVSMPIIRGVIINVKPSRKVGKKSDKG